MHDVRRPSTVVAPALALAMAGAVGVTIGIRSCRDAQPDRLVQRATVAFQSGRWDRAADILVRLRDPPVDAWVLRAQVAIARGRTDEALAALARVPDTHAMAPWARLRQGQLELRRQRLASAEAAFLRTLALDPRVDQARRELVYIYGMQLRRHDLDAQFRALAERAPLSRAEVMTWSLTRVINWEPHEVAADLQRFVAADPTDRWSRLALAESLRQQGQFHEAERTLDPLPATDVDARGLRARIALEAGDQRAAASLLAEGPADHPALAVLRGRLALHLRDVPGAIQQFRTALAREPHHRDALFGLGRALKLSGQAAAAEHWQKAALAQDALDNRLQSLALRPGSDDPATCSTLGDLCEAAGRLPEARAWYRLAIATNPLDLRSQQALFRLRRAPATAPPRERAL
jgi:tetratricopeptide (TPR) repeat protein